MQHDEQCSLIHITYNKIAIVNLLVLSERGEMYMNKMLPSKKMGCFRATDDQRVKFGYKILKRLKREKGYTVYGYKP